MHVFKSQAQRRKFYAMASRGEISHSKVKEWEKATGDKKLPERIEKKTGALLEKAGQLLKAAGFEKEAGILSGVGKFTMGAGDSLVGSLWPAAAAAGIGSVAAGPDQRAEGAVAGLLGAILGRKLLGRAASAAGEGAARQISEAAAKVHPSATAETEKILSEIERQRVAMGGRLGNMAAGGLGAAGVGYGLRMKRNFDAERGLEAAPVMYDAGGSYTGFLPGDYNMTPDTPLMGF